MFQISRVAYTKAGRHPRESGAWREAEARRVKGMPGQEVGLLRVAGVGCLYVAVGYSSCSTVCPVEAAQGELQCHRPLTHYLKELCRSAPCRQLCTRRGQPRFVRP